MKNQTIKLTPKAEDILQLSLDIYNAETDPAEKSKMVNHVLENLAAHDNTVKWGWTGGLYAAHFVEAGRAFIDIVKTH